jgi:transposase InsO family protein
VTRAIRVPLNASLCFGLKSSLHNLLVDKISVQRFYRYSGEFGRNPASMRLIITALFFLLTLRFRKRSSLEFEVIALRNQLAVLRRRKRRARNITPTDRFLWSWFYRINPKAKQWMQLVKPQTVVEWHRRSFLFYWRNRCNSKRAPSKIKDQLGRLILHMYNENTGWGVARIHAELLKLGYGINRGTVARYLFRHFGTHRLTQTRGWKIFLRHHMHDAAAIDMFMVISVSFRLLYAMVVIRLDRRTILHIDATERPTQEWLANGISRAFMENPKPRYLIRDRDACYGQKFCQRLKELGIRQHVIPRQTPWANIFVERIIYSIRRECLNHVIILNEQHLRRILGEYVEYYNRNRTHRSLGQDCPISRPAQTLSEGNCIISIPQVGGLHHRYERRKSSVVA